MNRILIPLLLMGRIMSCPGPEYNTYIVHKGESIRALYVAEGENSTDEECFRQFCADLYRESSRGKYPNKHLVLENDTLSIISGGFIEVPNLNEDHYPGNEEYYRENYRR